MRRWVIVLALAIGAVVFAAPGFGGNGKPKPHPVNASLLRHDVTFRRNLQLTDQGSCGNTWANLTVRRTVQVHRRAARMFRITITDRGTFDTMAGQSPAACAATVEPDHDLGQNDRGEAAHGTSVNAGHTGSVVSEINTVVRNGRFTPNAKIPVGANLAAFIAAVFGPNATFSCATATGACSQHSSFRAFNRPVNTTLKMRDFERQIVRKNNALQQELAGDIADN